MPQQRKAKVETGSCDLGWIAQLLARPDVIPSVLEGILTDSETIAPQGHPQ